MKINAQDIENAFNSLIGGDKTREEISNWAIGLCEASDNQNLEYDPKSDKERIWDAISFLEMVDVKHSPTKFFFEVEDFINYRDQFLHGNSRKVDI